LFEAEHGFSYCREIKLGSAASPEQCLLQFDQFITELSLINCVLAIGTNAFALVALALTSALAESTITSLAWLGLAWLGLA
jgi:hypothetical protein